MEIAKISFADFLAKSREAQAQAQAQAPEAQEQEQEQKQIQEEALLQTPYWFRKADGSIAPLDDFQKTALDACLSGNSIAVIGPAGSGKSSFMQAVLREIQKKQEHSFIPYKIVGAPKTYMDAPDVAVVSFTNTAAKGIKTKLLQEPQLAEFVGANVTTMHGLVEMQPMEEWSEKKDKTILVFRPKKHKENPLSVRILVIEEASQAGVGPGAIVNYVYDALQKGTQIILLGDINQLTPVGGKSILAYGLLQLPAYELKEIHRQALENPIIYESHRVLAGHKVKQHIKEGKGVAMLPLGNGKENLSADKHLRMWNAVLPELFRQGKYDPLQDMILCPYTKAKNTSLTNIALNDGVAAFLAQKEAREVWEIFAGFGRKLYLSIGDRVLVNRQLGTVVGIHRNKAYYGPIPRNPSKNLTHYGLCKELEEFEDMDWDYSALDIGKLKESLQDAQEKNGKEERGERISNNASHVVLVQLDDLYEPVEVSKCGQFAIEVFSLGYSMTEYKAQGQEWRNVFIHIHGSHRNALFRENLYTGMTRAKETVVLVGNSYAYEKCVETPRLKGNSMEDKIEFFKGGYLDQAFTVDPKHPNRRHGPHVEGYEKQDFGNFGEEEE